MAHVGTLDPSARANSVREHASLFDTSRQAVIGTTLDGEIVYWSAAAELLYGWKQDEVLGRPIVEVTPTDTSREVAEEIMERLRRGHSWAGGFQVRDRAGREFEVMVRDVPVQDLSGQLVGIVGISSRG